MAYTTCWNGSGGRPRGGGKKKGIELCIDHSGPSSLDQHWQQAGWRLRFYWHRQLWKELLASTRANVALMLTDCFPFGENQEDVHCLPGAASVVPPLVNELLPQVQEASCEGRDLCSSDRHSAVSWREDWNSSVSDSTWNISKCNKPFMSINWEKNKTIAWIYGTFFFKFHSVSFLFWTIFWFYEID